MAKDRIKVVYTPSTEIIANGLIKALPANKFQSFVDSLGLVLYKMEESKEIDELDYLEG